MPPASQLAALAAYVSGGGSVLVLAAEGGDGKQGSNVGDFTAEFGITINGDIVLRTVFYKYLHPKEAFVSRGCLSKAFGAAVARVQARTRSAAAALTGGETTPGGSGGGGSATGRRDTALLVARGADGVEFAYPRGCSLSVARTAVPLLSTGNVCYPIQRPVAAVVQSRGGGRLCVVGSAEAFSDEWLGKECNAAIADTLFRWLAKVDVAAAAAGGSAAGGGGDGSSDDDAEINAAIASLATAAGGGGPAGGAGVPSAVLPRSMVQGHPGAGARGHKGGWWWEGGGVGAPAAVLLLGGGHDLLACALPPLQAATRLRTARAGVPRWRSTTTCQIRSPSRSGCGPACRRASRCRRTSCGSSTTRSSSSTRAPSPRRCRSSTRWV